MAIHTSALFRLQRFLLLASLMCLALGAVTAGASTSPDAVWSDRAESTIARSPEPRRIVPSAYRTLELDRARLSAVLARTPLESQVTIGDSNVRLTLPLADGRFSEFQIVESPIMEPALAARFPEIRTWLGQGVDDRTATLRFDLTPTGFHAQIISWEGTTFIDPFQPGDLDHYISYRKRDAQKDERMRCLVTGEELPEDVPNFQKRGVAVNLASGTSLRTYRTAVAATGEYTAFHGGTMPLGLAAIVTTMNRVNGIYERELSVRMVLVANNNLIVYTNGGSDPYTNGDPFTMINQNQTNLDTVIGSANYDIGHVVATNSGGLAGLGVVCLAGNKARGVTGSGAPVGDPFDVDYVAHEIGHQFAGNHTFNSNAGACSGGNRNGPTAYETGSGISIQAYAGICGADDVQPNSSDYFHRVSLDEMLGYVAGAGASCGTSAATGNTPPNVATTATYTIPRQTPFALTASGSDANGDTLTYLWEQFNLGPANPAGSLTDNGGPLFRNFSPNLSPTRTFPALANILNGSNGAQWELLPGTNRTMNFRVTARDNRAGGGGTNDAMTALTVTTTAGPFLVTAPNTAVTWNAGLPQTVTWNVANTTAAPVNTATVRISLSLDGGVSFPLVLATGEPNDGSATLPLTGATPTTQARIKVEAEGNVYFDISNVNFTITGTASPVIINEIDYDQTGADAAEWFELKNISGGVVNLDNYSVELVNGNSGGAAVYDTIDLPNVNLAAGDYFVICANAATVPNCDLDDAPNTDFIQNGAPDAIGLRLSGVLVDAVSYEGNSGAPYTESSGVGLIDSGAVDFQGISRFPDGADTNVNNVDFSPRCITPGLSNATAATGCPNPANPAGVVLTESGGSTNVAEGGATDTYTLVLNSQPTADVSVAINSGAQVTVGSSPIVFTPANWATAQTVTVTAVDDAVVEGAHTGTISHTVTSTDAAYNGISVPNVVANIADNDSMPPTVTITPASFNVSEGANDNFTITRTGSTTSTLPVTVNVTLGTGTVDADYDLSGGSISGQTGSVSVTIPAGQASVNVNFAALDDVDAEASNTLTIALVDGAAYDLGATTSATATIPQNDLVVTNPNDDGDGSLRQAVLNANDFSGDDTVTFAVSGTISLSSTIEAGSADQLTINGGGVITLTKSVPSAMALIGTLFSTDLVILDGLTFSAGSNGRGVAANSGTVTIRNSTFSGNTGLGAISTVSILLTVENSIFTNNSSNDGFDGGAIEVIGGNLTVVNSLFTGNSTTSNGGGIYISNGNVTLINSTFSGNSANDGGNLHVASGTANLRNTILADATSGGECTRAGGTINAQNSLIEGGLGCVNGTNTSSLTGDPALNGSFNLTNASIAINAGDNTHIAGYSTDLAGNTRIQETTVDLGAYESSFGAPIPVVSISATDNSGAEAGSDALTFTIARSGASTIAALPVSYTVSGSAINGTDYTPTLTGTVDIPAGGTSVNLTVTSNDDAIVEGSETVVIALSSSAGYTINAGANMDNATISDNDTAVVGFAANDDVFAEAGGNFQKTVVLTITASGVGPAALQNALVVPLTFTEAGALEPEDFTLTTAQVTFPAGATTGASQNAIAAIVNDAIDEDAESFAINLVTAGAPGNINFGRSTTNVQINDDDTAGVTLVQSGGNTAATEGGATDTYTLVLNSQPTAPVTIALTGTQVTPTTGLPPAIPEGLPAGASVNFSAANWNQAQTVTVTALNDTVVEGAHAGSVAHAVTSGDPKYQALTVPPLAVAITDNDTATVVFAAAGSAFAEGSNRADTARLDVTGNGAPGGTVAGAVIVDLTLTNGTTEAADVAVTSGAQLSFAPGSAHGATAAFSLLAFNDRAVEANETFSLGLSVSSGLATAGPAADYSVTDNDTAAIEFASPTSNAPEGTTPHSVNVLLGITGVGTGPLVLEDAVSVAITDTAGTATTPADYTRTTASVSFAAGSADGATQPILASIVDDALYEGNHTFALGFGAVTSVSADVTAAGAHTATIVDNDPLPVISITSPSQLEGNAGNTPMNFVVSLSAPAGVDVSFTRATANGTATLADNDYQQLTATGATIPAGQSGTTLTVQIVGDTTFEGNETFRLDLSSIVNATVAVPPLIEGTPVVLTGTGTIEEDDRQPTTTTITSDLPDASVVGQPYAVVVDVAAVSAAPLGTISVSDGTDSCGPVTLTTAAPTISTASCALTSTTAGAKTLTATYTPASTAFAASSDTEAHQVNAASTAISVVGPPRSRINQPTTFTFALSVNAPGAGTPAGTVTLSSGSASCNVTVPTATPSCALTFAALGSRTVAAAFAPSNGNFLASSSSGPANAQTLVFALSDIAVTKSDGVGTYRPGDLVVYTVTVRNLGADAAANIRVRDQVPAGLVNVDWTCDASGGVACPATGGSGDLDLTVSAFPVGGLLNFTFFGNVSGSPAQIVNTALVELPADTTIEDPVPGDNSASDTNQLELLFKNGFEAVAVNAPAGSFRLPSASLRASLDEVAVVVYGLDDVNGDALRVYARVVGSQLQYALATRNPQGRLRLAAWASYTGDPLLTWTARPVTDGWVLDSAELR